MSGEKEQIVRNVVSLLWKSVSYVYTYPQRLLYGWAIGWGVVLLITLKDNGPGQVVLLITSGMFNAGSVLGLAIPMLALSLIFAQYIIPAAWNFLEDAFYRIFRKVKKEFEEAYNKIKEVLAEITKGIKDLIEKIKDLADKVAEMFNKIANGVKDGVKDAGNAIKNGIKNLFGSELQDIRETHRTLLGHLDELDKLAPEEKAFTDNLRQLSTDAVDVVVSPDVRSLYVGGDLGLDLDSLHLEMVTQVNLLSENLLGRAG